MTIVAFVHFYFFLRGVSCVTAIKGRFFLRLRTTAHVSSPIKHFLDDDFTTIDEPSQRTPVLHKAFIHIYIYIMYNAIKETISVIYETSAAKGFFSTHFLFLGGGATLPPSRIKKKLRKRAHECRCVFLMWRVASTNGSEASPSSIIGGTSFLGQLAFHWLFFCRGTQCNSTKL